MACDRDLGLTARADLLAGVRHKRDLLRSNRKTSLLDAVLGDSSQAAAELHTLRPPREDVSSTRIAWPSYGANARPPTATTPGEVRKSAPFPAASSIHHKVSLGASPDTHEPLVREGRAVVAPLGPRGLASGGFVLDTFRFDPMCMD